MPVVTRANCKEPPRHGSPRIRTHKYPSQPCKSCGDDHNRTTLRATALLILPICRKFVSLVSDMFKRDKFEREGRHER